MSEINLEFILGAMPTGEATLHRVLIQSIPAPSAAAPNLGGRQIEMAELARLTDFSERWVIELMHRLEKKNFIRTDGGSGAVKWIWLLPLGVLRLGKSYPTEPTQEEATSPAPGPRKAKVPRDAASQPKRRRKERAPIPDADVNVAPAVEKPAEIPARRREIPMPSIPPADPAPGNPVVLATMMIPPPPSAPADPTLLAAVVPPPPPSMAPGGLAAGNSVPAATVTPAPSRARGGRRQANLRWLPPQ